MTGKQMVEAQMRLGRHHDLSTPVRREPVGDDLHQLGRARRKLFNLRTGEKAYGDLHGDLLRVRGLQAEPEPVARGFAYVHPLGPARERPLDPGLY